MPQIITKLPEYLRQICCHNVIHLFQSDHGGLYTGKNTNQMWNNFKIKIDEKHVKLECQ